jgi:hypothetical protein
LPDGQPADTLSEWVSVYNLADGTQNLNTTRAMGFGSVNAPQATSVVGHSPEIDSEFIVTHLIGTRH